METDKTPSPQTRVTGKCPHCDGTGDASEKGRVEECLACEGTGKVAPVNVYRILREAADNGTLDREHISSLSRRIAALYPAPQPHVLPDWLIERVQNCVLSSNITEFAGLADHAAFEAGQDNAVANIVKMLRAISTEDNAAPQTKTVGSAVPPRALQFVKRVAALNRDAGEIGAGMLASLVDEANAILQETGTKP